MRVIWCVPDYAYPRWCETPSSSKAWRWTGVGVVMTVKAGRPPAGWIWLAAMVARSASMVVKLCTGPRSGVALVAALASAAGERWAGAAGLGRAALPAAGSWSLNSIGASRCCMFNRIPQLSSLRHADLHDYLPAKGRAGPAWSQAPEACQGPMLRGNFGLVELGSEGRALEPPGTPGADQVKSGVNERASGAK